jgi:hypothetical protein
MPASSRPGVRAARPPGRPALEPSPAPAGRRADLVTAALAAWLVGGVFLDGWAHNTRPVLESFFTPWHAAFYSGFAAVAAWIGWSVWTRRAAAGSWRGSVPPGYGLGLAGAAIFLVSGVGDLCWHLAFGIERDIAALLSPTHLGLFCGAFLVVTTPLRSAWADPALERSASLERLLPAVLSLALAGTLTAFMFQYLHPVVDNVVSVGHELSLRLEYTPFQYTEVYRLGIQAGVSGFVVSTAILFGPVLFLLRRWRPPTGAAALLLGLQCLAMQAVTGFADAGLLVLGLLGAVAVEGLLALLRPSPVRRWPLLAFSAAAPVAFWAVYLGGVGAHDGGLGWTPEVWGGTLVWSGLTLLALAIVMFPPAVPEPAAGAAGLSPRP